MRQTEHTAVYWCDTRAHGEHAAGRCNRCYGVTVGVSRGPARSVVLVLARFDGPPAAHYDRRMPRKPPDPAVVQRALDLVRSGVSQQEIARQLGVSHTTIQRWARVADVQPVGTQLPATATGEDLPARLRAFAAELDEADVPARASLCRTAATALDTASVQATLAPMPAIDATDVVGAMQSAIARMAAAGEKAAAVGDTRTWQKSLTEMGSLLNNLARVQDRADAEDGVHRVTDRELKASEAQYDEWVRETLNRPGGLVCERCSAEISVAMAELDPDASAVASKRRR